MAKNQKKPSYLRLESIDPNSGEIVSAYNQMTQDKVSIKGHYIKFFQDFLEKI